MEHGNVLTVEQPRVVTTPNSTTTEIECLCHRTPHHVLCPVAVAEREERERFGPILEGVAGCGLPERFTTGVATISSLKANGDGLAAGIAATGLWMRLEGHPWLYFASRTPGTGKTHLAAAGLAAAIRLGRHGRFTKLSRMLMEISDAPLGSKVATFDRFAKARMLVIDEVGAEKASAFTVATLSQVLDERYDARRPTIITSNLNLSELGEKWSPSDEIVAAQRIVDRIYEMTGGKEGSGRIWFNGKSWRKN